MIEHHERTPVPFSEIGNSSLAAAHKIHDVSPSFRTSIEHAWEKVTVHLIREKNFWLGPYPVLSEFYKTVIHESLRIRPQESFQVPYMIDQWGGVNDDFITLAGFLEHDLEYLGPRFGLNFMDSALQSRYQAPNDMVRIFDNQKTHMEEFVKRAEDLAHAFALPFEFVHAVMMQESAQPVPTERFNPLDLLDLIALQLRGRFAAEDFVIVKNADFPTDEKSNHIVINGSGNISVVANRAMLYLLIENIAKNAAKANTIKHYREHDEALIKRYTQEQLANPRNIAISMTDDTDLLIVSVSDEGDGISLDGSIKRAQMELAEQIKKQGIDRVRHTEWYRNLTRILGDQAELFIAWPSNPFALREITIGTLFDLQFVAGFSGKSWKIRSFTSGTGLWGVRYVTEHLGGTVMGTNKFEGGAYFSIAIPKKNLSVEYTSIPGSQS